MSVRPGKLFRRTTVRCDRRPLPAMTTSQLSTLLPELAILVRRDGVLLEHLGGEAVRQLRLTETDTGKTLRGLWGEESAATVMQGVRRAIANRSSADVRVPLGESTYEVRITPQGPDRAICVLRVAAEKSSGDMPSRADGRVPGCFDRRGFLRRFEAAMATAALRETPTAVAGIYVDGLLDIARVVEEGVADQVLMKAIARLAPEPEKEAASSDEPPWCMGQLGEGFLALLIESADRDAIDQCVGRVCAKLRAPVVLGSATFHLTPYAGVAILGQDAATPKSLLDHARAAAAEAKGSGTQGVCFFTDTLKLRSLARLDVARELRDAIEKGELRLRVVGRHDLESGRLVAHVGYLSWLHPLRGAVRPEEFLRVAEATGLSRSVSRAAFDCLRCDYAGLAGHSDSGVRLSIGPLRHHLLDRDFTLDVVRFLQESAIPADRLEIRVSERAFLVMDPKALTRIRDQGVQLVVDEVGREISSFHRLARAPLSGLQLDRSWASTLRSDPLALRVCRAGIGVAAALGLTPIATGVDDVDQRKALLGLGCRQGLGDHFRGGAEATEAPPAKDRADPRGRCRAPPTP